jgi:hypothetical protein
MKKQLLLCATLFVSTLAFAQQPSFGVRAGISSSGMRGDAVNSLRNLLDFTNGRISTNNQTAFFAGGYVSVPLSSVISVEPGLYYSQKGYQLNGALNVKGVEFLGVDAKAKLTSHYIDFPVVIKANISGLQLFAGPQFSYLVNAGLRTTAGVLGFNLLNTNIDATSQFSRMDMALTGGLGYQFANGFNVMAAYDYGMLKADANRNLNSYNHSLKLGIGMSF